MQDAPPQEDHMPRYIVQHFYSSHVAQYQAGQVVELDGVTADWFNRDSPGVLKLIVDAPPAPEPEPVVERVIEQPPKDRMLRSKAIGKRVRR